MIINVCLYILSLFQYILLEFLCRVRQKQSRGAAAAIDKEEEDPYGGSTDEENGEK